MNPVFIFRMLQSLSGLTSGFSIGRRSQRRREEPAFVSSKFRFEAGGWWRWWGEGSRTSEETRGGMGERRLFLLTFGYGSETASICLRNLHFSSTKFSFRSPDRMRRMHASAHSTSGAWSGTGTPVPATGGNLERETCLLVHWGFAKSCLSACRRSTDNNLGTFFILYLNLDLFV